jgi:uncharacterized protein YbjT (DUF2867 family)
MSLKAVIAGSTGLIGSKLLEILLAEPAYNEVIVLVRKETGRKHEKLREVVVDFAKLEDHAADIAGHAVFCCIGTTKKKTPNLDKYYEIEHDYPIKLAQLAAGNGVSQYHFVSSIGADKDSSAYYTKFKGQTEHDLQQLNFKTLHIYRPSLLTDDRKEFRLIEKMATGLMYVVNPLLIGSLKKYRSIPAQTVAHAMYNQSITKNEGVFIHSSDQIKQIA